MSSKEILWKCLSVASIYLVIVNTVKILEKILFPVYISNYLIAPNILMMLIGIVMWIIAKSLLKTENEIIKNYIEYKIGGLIVLANGFYESLNLIWVGIYSYADRPQIMIGSTEVSGSEGVLLVLKIILPHLAIYLAEMVIGIILLLGVKKVTNKIYAR